ncbi:SURF1 family protein [Bradyrhizobium sp. NP1]|uniref:SURF1 family protein n=1 Tax=Bradyrhizobium sp. NP1 TaxID=3049772 RepID=UPI0025A5DC23|nr:SURF1 family protein [Bradyrhizobium sp. NP1]WJR79036.1 SURF1 family protein [Bradyrhizobium sp. NP1]
MNGQPERQRRTAGFAAFTFVMLAVFVGLGIWQLERRVEKHALISALTERLAAEPSPLPPASRWATLHADADEFRRVRFEAAYARLPDAMVYSAGSAVREDISGPGTWAFLPARLPTGEVVVVNAGFVANTMQDREVENRAVTRLVTGTPAMLTGYLRFPESAGLLTPAPSLEKRLWFVRDHLAMAHALGWGSVAPFYIDLESPVPDNGIPKPGPLSVHLRDEHMQYAVTWFSLAAVVAVAFLLWWRRRAVA